MSFNFGTSTPKTAASGFTLPSNPVTVGTTPQTQAFSFGSGAGDNKSPSKPTGLFGTPTASVAPTLSFGLPQPKTTAPTFSFGGPASSTSTPAQSLGVASVAPTVSAAPQFSFGNKPAATGTPTALTASLAPAASFTPILGTTTAASSTSKTTAAPTLTFGSLATPATSATSIIAATTTTTSATVQPTTSVAASTTTTASTAKQMTFSQLEDSINKWTIDLEEQGKFFVNQAKQLNAWDLLLTSNGEKILNLNNSIERVKQQQQQLDQELDFVLAQQKELEELIKPLEKELVDTPVTDIDRNQMYQFSEVIDSQLKQMSDDLKEIIEHINESNKSEEDSNPIVQIGRILNAHMNSLQWIDRNTAQISTQLEEITKMQDLNKQNLSLNSSLNP